MTGANKDLTWENLNRTAFLLIEQKEGSSKQEAEEKKEEKIEEAKFKMTTEQQISAQQQNVFSFCVSKEMSALWEEQHPQGNSSTASTRQLKHSSSARRHSCSESTAPRSRRSVIAWFSRCHRAISPLSSAQPRGISAAPGSAPGWGDAPVPVATPPGAAAAPATLCTSGGWTPSSAGGGKEHPYPARGAAHRSVCAAAAWQLTAPRTFLTDPGWGKRSGGARWENGGSRQPLGFARLGGSAPRRAGGSRQRGARCQTAAPSGGGRAAPHPSAAAGSPACSSWAVPVKRTRAERPESPSPTRHPAGRASALPAT